MSLFDRARAFEALAEMTGGVLHALAAEHLLHATELLLGRWFDDAADRLALRQPTVRVPLTHLAPEAFATTFLAAWSERARDHIHPLEFTVSGHGVVLLASGARVECPDLIWLAGTASPVGTSLCLSTQSEAWLSHTLLGRPQPGVRRANAPRLERALKAAEAATQQDWETDAHTKLAAMTPYGVANFTTDAGGIYVPERARGLSDH